MKKKNINLILLVLIIIIDYHDVTNELSLDDIKSIDKFLKYNNIVLRKQILSSDEEIHYIQTLQSCVIDIFPHYSSIPLDNSREPQALMDAQSGFCFDRSRFLEKLFIYSGFQTRRVSLFQTTKNYSLPILFRQKDVSSHSILELKTIKGWLVIDSNLKWVAIDKKNNPYSMKTINKFLIKRVDGIDWISDIPKENLPFYNKPSFFVYGLLSRHGRFYPPYNCIPDFCIKELYFNFN